MYIIKARLTNEPEKRGKMKTKRYYVGLKPNGVRAVFYMAVVEPTQEMCPQYNAVIGPFRTKRGAEFMAKYGAGNPHCQTVQDAEKLAANYVPSVSEQTVYVASAWW